MCVLFLGGLKLGCARSEGSEHIGEGIHVLPCISIQYQKNRGRKKTKKDRANKKAKEGKCSVTVATLFLFVVKARP